MWFITYCNAFKCRAWPSMYDNWQACLYAANELVRVMDSSAWCELVKA